MNLTVLCPHFAPDPAPTGEVITRIVLELAERAHEVHVVTALPWYTHHRIEEGWGGRLVRRERTPWGSITRVHPFPADKTSLALRAVSFSAFSALSGVAALSGGRMDAVLAMSPPLPIGLVAWAKAFMPAGPEIEPRGTLASTDEEIEEFSDDFAIGERELARRGLLTKLLLGAVGALGLGALYPIFSLGPDPNSAFDIKFTIMPIIMTLFGGMGTVVGPVIGAVLLEVISDFSWLYLGRMNITIFGLILIALVLWLPDGMITRLKESGKLPKTRGI